MVYYRLFWLSGSRQGEEEPTVSTLSKCLRERDVGTKDSCLARRRQTHRLDGFEGGGKEDSPEKVT